MSILINLLIILAIIAVFVLILYLFEKFVMPVDGKVKGIIVFIVFVILMVYVLTGHTLIAIR